MFFCRLEEKPGKEMQASSLDICAFYSIFPKIDSIHTRREEECIVPRTYATIRLWILYNSVKVDYDKYICSLGIQISGRLKVVQKLCVYESMKMYLDLCVSGLWVFMQWFIYLRLLRRKKKVNLLNLYTVPYFFLLTDIKNVNPIGHLYFIDCKNLLFLSWEICHEILCIFAIFLNDAINSPWISNTAFFLHLKLGIISHTLVNLNVFNK